MKIFKIKNLIFFFVLIFLSCSNDSEDDLINQPQTPQVITFTNDIKSIMDNNCISCHSNPAINGASVPLTDFNNVKNAVVNNNLINRISTTPGQSGAMPFGGPQLPQNLIDLVIHWQTDGFEN